MQGSRELQSRQRSGDPQLLDHSYEEEQSSPTFGLHAVHVFCLFTLPSLDDNWSIQVANIPRGSSYAEVN